MREFDDKTSWEGARAEVLFTASVLEAAGAHERLLKALRQQLERWTAVETARRGADDAIVKANARVSWADHVLDLAVRGFANEVLRDAGGNAEHKQFKAYFPEPPNEIIRLGLESEVERCERFAAVRSKVTLSKTAAARLGAVDKAVVAGRSALAQRREAYTAQAQASLDVGNWKEATNGARVSAFVQLQAWALENENERSYADRFFPTRATRKVASGATPKDDKTGDEPRKDEKPEG